jgi:hypothetical protein
VDHYCCYIWLHRGLGCVNRNGVNNGDYNTRVVLAFAFGALLGFAPLVVAISARSRGENVEYGGVSTTRILIISRQRHRENNRTHGRNGLYALRGRNARRAGCELNGSGGGRVCTLRSLLNVPP